MHFSSPFNAVSVGLANNSHCTLQKASYWCPCAPVIVSFPPLSLSALQSL